MIWLFYQWSAKKDMPYFSENMDRLEVYTSKKKSLVFLIGSIAFVTIGIVSAADPERFVTELWSNPELIRLVAIAAILFFGFGVLVFIRRLIKNEIALIIDVKGINVNPRRSTTEFIEWKEILGFQEIRIHRTRIIIIVVKDPEYWIEKETSTIRKKMMRFNLNNYGSPFNIAAAGLDIGFDKLNGELNSYFEKYKNKVKNFD